MGMTKMRPTFLRRLPPSPILFRPPPPSGVARAEGDGSSRALLVIPLEATCRLGCHARAGRGADNLGSCAIPAVIGTTQSGSCPADAGSAMAPALFGRMGGH